MPELLVPDVQTQINSYLEHPHTVGLSKETRKAYKCVLQGQLLEFCEKSQITTFDTSFEDKMENFVSYLLGHGANPYTIQHYLTITKFFMKKIGAPINHTYKIPRDAKRRHDLKHQRRWFTDQDIAQCMTYQFPVMHVRNHLLVRLLVETGARINEIAHITVGNVNFGKRTILISYSKTIPRPVFFSQESGIFMKRYFKTEFTEPESAADQRIFPGKNQLYKVVVGMLDDLGLKSHGDCRGPHTFRHYVATYLHYVKNMKLTSVAALLGDTPETISSNYLHPTAEMLQSEVERAWG
ncbi:tyrosine-type recombinase/integrase [uncultured Desulfobacter sp.]|uniref:tyrosine-type recombinase/integrase n=1 Tax=uncultured Desulfobacter sp. TaxID=240139 RepID=UPI0029F5671B|nr:tyrosine-type recombinase/integrase [uncultured Desulfobacter sp.]